MKKEEETIKTVKGFDHELKCRDKQYEIGQTYTEEGNPEVCKHGLHAISPDASPLSVFGYYPPSVNGNPSRYCEVEASGDIASDGEKIAASKLTVEAEIGIPGIVKAHIEWVKRNVVIKKEGGDCSSVSGGDCSSVSGGYRSSVSGGDDSSVSGGDDSSVSGGDDSSVSGGDCSSVSGGYRSSVSGGYRSSVSGGDCSNVSGGNCSSVSGGDCSNVSGGNCSSVSSRGSSAVGKNGVAVARGNNVKVKGGMGALLVIANENSSNYDIKEWKAAIVDGKTIKADTWYTVENGEWKELQEQ